MTSGASPTTCFFVCFGGEILPFDWLSVVIGIVITVVLHADPDDVAACGLAMVVCVAQRIDATAVFLLVEALTLADLDHPRRTATLAPVVIPVADSSVFGR